jgi:hypothetical protein
LLEPNLNFWSDRYNVVYVSQMSIKYGKAYFNGKKNSIKTTPYKNKI